MILDNVSSHACIMLIGLPGAGKSTLIDTINVELNSVPVISTDKYLDQYAKEKGLTYGQVYRDYSEAAEKSMKIELAKVIKDRKNFIWDQTNVFLSARNKKIKYLKTQKYDVLAFYFDLPEDLLKERIKLRFEKTGKFIPEKIFQQMKEAYVLPDFSEGFKKIYRVDEKSIVELFFTDKKNNI